MTVSLNTFPMSLVHSPWSICSIHLYTYCMCHTCGLSLKQQLMITFVVVTSGVCHVHWSTQTGPGACTQNSRSGMNELPLNCSRVLHTVTEHRQKYGARPKKHLTPHISRTATAQQNSKFWNKSQLKYLKYGTVLVMHQHCKHMY